MQLLLRIIIYYISSSECLSLIHSHIEWRIETGGETSLTFVKLVTADAKVSKYSINCIYIMQFQEALQVTKIMRHENDP